MNPAGALESKAKKEIRKSGGLPTGQKIHITEDNTYRTFALRIFLANLLIKRTDITFTENPDEADKIYTGETLNDAAENLLQNVFEGTVLEHIDACKARITPFASLTSDEVLAYAQYFGWEKAGQENITPAHAFLTRFTRDHPATPYALKNIRDSLKTKVQQ